MNCERIMDTEKIKEIFSDKEYLQSLLNMHSYEEVQASLEEKGIDISIKELREIRELLIKISKGELTDADLEKVAGGSTGLLIASFIGGIIFGAGGATYLTLMTCR